MICIIDTNSSKSLEHKCKICANAFRHSFFVKMPVLGDKNVDSSLQCRKQAQKSLDFGLAFPFLVKKNFSGMPPDMIAFIPLILGRPLI